MVSRLWSSEAVDRYRTLVRARLAEHNCGRCGASLEPAALLVADNGTTLEEYGLLGESDAAILAATEHLAVRCLACGATADLGRSRLHTPPAPEIRAPEVPWDADAVDTYRALIRGRLSEQSCTGCGQPLAAASVVAVFGGTYLDDYGLSDSAAAQALAATQDIVVKCQACNAEIKVRGAA